MNKHIRAISGTPKKAATATTGGIVGAVGQLVTIIGAFFTQKEASQIQDL